MCSWSIPAKSAHNKLLRLYFFVVEMCELCSVKAEARRLYSNLYVQIRMKKEKEVIV